ncbi:DUF4912 domain-containing protein [Magnetospira sp. QH-2]|uniref:DUF4912 domain-containing protein n=1 Tax=Magnetospira sp. (strain QH-2) TaxID=1288970 RepID=UPI0003E81639|nr:DUF4912 domain-containing protein [Magnetospira sp. QH-2]CCQ73905.1 Protein of unknown function [Magnetospira sp. QH-2]
MSGDQASGGQPRATGQKKPFTAAELRRISDRINDHFPPPDRESRLTLLDVDPRRIHAYWTITPDDLPIVSADSPASGAMVLRLYDVSAADQRQGPPSAPFDMEVQGLKGSFYVDLWQEGRSYVAELGLRNKDDSFRRLARSNLVDLPSTERAPELPEERIAIEFPTTGPIFEESPPPSFADADDLFEDLYQDDTWDSSSLELPEEEQAFPEILDGFNSDTPDSTPLPIPSSSVSSTPPMTDDESDDSFPEIDDETLVTESIHTMVEESRILAAMGGDPWGEVPVPAESRHQPASADAPPAPESAPSPVQSSSDTVPIHSSYVLAGSEDCLEIHAELHIFGRTKPGHNLTLQGEPVPVRPDGSFSLRRPLPAGAVVLPLVVTDENGNDT